MPVCPSCGKQFSGFSFGAKTATECRECRAAKASAMANAAVQSSPYLPLVRSTLGAAMPVVTLGIIAINLAVYVGMGLSGASWTEPSIPHAIRWGADFGALALSGEWWRLLSSVFVHFGIIHILFNMWCLWDLGRTLEPMMGRTAYAVMYLVSGITASAVSLGWNQWRVSAGASGAIFGVAGALVSYLYLKKTPIDQAVVRQRLKSLAAFIIYNLFYGAVRFGIDNSAHLGGLVAGLMLGALIPASMSAGSLAAGGAGQTAGDATGSSFENTSSQNSSENRLLWIGVASSMMLVLGLFQIQKMHLPAARYGMSVRLVRAGHLEEAIAKMQEAVTLDPNLVYAQALLGELRLAQKNPAAAIAPLEKTLELSPKSNLVRHNLALAYLGAGRPADAARHISQVMDKEKESQWAAYFIFGLAAEQMDTTGVASKYLHLAFPLKPDFYEAQDALGRLALLQGRFDEAQAIYSDVLQHHPDDPVANSDMRLAKLSGKTRIQPSDLASFPIPYSKLALKSAAFPYYP